MLTIRYFLLSSLIFKIAMTDHLKVMATFIHSNFQRTFTLNSIYVFRFNMLYHGLCILMVEDRDFDILKIQHFTILMKALLAIYLVTNLNDKHSLLKSANVQKIGKDWQIFMNASL